MAAMSPIASRSPERKRRVQSHQASRRRGSLVEEVWNEHEEFAATCICMSDHGLLDRQKMRFYAESSQSAARDSVLFCSRPTVALYSKKLYPTALLIVAVMIISGGCKNLFVYHTSHLRSASRFRFTALELRDQSSTGMASRERLFEKNSSSIVSEFGLLLHGCACLSQERKEEHLGTTTTLTFSVPVEMDGFYFITNSFDSGIDPISFVVHASEGEEASWKEIGSSTYQAGHTDDVPGPYVVPTGRKEMVKYDLRPISFGWIHLNIINALLVGTYLSTISLLGLFTYRQDLIYPIITSVYCFNSLLWLAATFDNDYNISSFAVVACVVYGIAGATIYAGERYLWVFIVELGSGLTIMGLYGRFWLWQGAKFSETPNILLAYGILMLIIIAYSFLSYQYVLRTAHQLIIEDKVKYDAVWSTVYGAQIEQLRQLDECVEKILEEQRPSGQLQGPLQLAHQFTATDHFFRRPFYFYKTNTSRAPLPETSLSHLFLTARFVHPILKFKVQDWALGSRGHFFSELGPGGSYAQWQPPQNASAEEVAEYRDTMRFRFAELKLPSRAVAKTVRSYGGDVSKIVDICRQAIVFESVSDLAQCVDTITNDPQVAVERIKNRMSLKSTVSSNTTGYRDVLINLRIMDESTRRIGADWHVCEVQLVLREVALLKNNEGHKRYVDFRNYRSE